MNITKVDGSYSKELFENMNEIKACSFSGYSTVEDMRELVLEIIEPAWIGTVARNRFIVISIIASLRKKFTGCAIILFRKQ